MQRMLIASGVILMALVLVGSGPLAGYAIQRKRRISNAEFIAEVQRTGELAQVPSDSVVDPVEELDPERYFYEDPLFSYVLPAQLDSGMPIFDQAFEALAAKKILTGVGVDVDPDWKAWDLDIDFVIEEIFKEELVPA
jgi:hypothetical protein